MNTLGYLLIFVAAILLRSVQRGRASNIPEDTQDTLVAILTGDIAMLKEVAARRGSDNDAATAESVPETGVEAATGGENGARLLAQARKLGGAAKGYGWGLTGPTRYDCSGLVWRAGKDIGIYTGPRYTTSSFTRVSVTWAVATSSPTVGDIVLWPGKHMGIVSGSNMCYSARSVEHGIGESTIDGTSKVLGITAQYFRVK